MGRIMNAKYLKDKKQWSAFTTISGMDIQEYGKTEHDALSKLANRIALCPNLLKGIKIKI